MTGFLVGFGATCADMTFFTLVVFGLLRTVPDRRWLGALGLVGVVIMDLFAYQAFRAARRPPNLEEKGATGWAGGYFLAFMSPFNWLWWLTSGVPFISLYGASLGIGFFAALLSWVVLMVFLFSVGSAKIARFEMYVSYASAAMLVGYGLFLAYTSLRFLTGR